MVELGLQVSYLRSRLCQTRTITTRAALSMRYRNTYEAALKATGHSRLPESSPISLPAKGTFARRAAPSRIDSVARWAAFSSLPARKASRR